MSRTDSGVLTGRFHTNDGPATFSGQMHTDFRRPYEIGEDRDNRVLVLTGTCDSFMTDIDGASLGDITKPANWDRTVGEGRRVMQRLVRLQLLTRYLAVTLRQRVSRRMAEGAALALALEGLTAADRAYQQK